MRRRNSAEIQEQFIGTLGTMNFRLNGPQNLSQKYKEFL
jgi:hypothetical protein